MPMIMYINQNTKVVRFQAFSDVLVYEDNATILILMQCHIPKFLQDSLIHCTFMYNHSMPK